MTWPRVPHRCIGLATLSETSPPLTDPPAGWLRESLTEFVSPAALGQVAGETAGQGTGIYKDLLELYPATWTDNSGMSLYDYMRTLTVSDGSLQIRCHVDDSQAYSAAMTILHPTLGDAITPGHAIEFEMWVEGTSPFGHVMLLWPTSDVWADGEIDFPEGPHDGKPHAYHHEMGANPAANAAVWDNPGGSIAWADKHVYRMEYLAGEFRYLVDRNLVLSVTGEHVSSTPKRLVLQAGVHDTPPDPADQSTVHMSWIAFDALEA